MSIEQNQSSSESSFQDLWSTLQADENYPGLANYVMQKLFNLHRDFTELRNSVYGSISPEQRELMDQLVGDICHPPPGCFDSEI